MQQLDSLLIDEAGSRAEFKTLATPFIDHPHRDRACGRMELERLTLLAEGAMRNEVSNLSADVDEGVVEGFRHRIRDVERRLELGLPIGLGEGAHLLAGGALPTKDRHEDEGMLGPTEKALDRRDGVVAAFAPKLDSGE